MPNYKAALGLGLKTEIDKYKSEVCSAKTTFFKKFRAE
jgi:hypothetical protein